MDVEGCRRLRDGAKSVISYNNMYVCMCVGRSAATVKHSKSRREGKELIYGIRGLPL